MIPIWNPLQHNPNIIEMESKSPLKKSSTVQFDVIYLIIWKWHSVVADNLKPSTRLFW